MKKIISKSIIAILFVGTSTMVLADEFRSFQSNVSTTVQPSRKSVEVQRDSFSSQINSPAREAQNGAITSVTRVNDEESFRERDLRERESRSRNWQSRQRGVDSSVSPRERAFKDRELFNSGLREREWDNPSARDQELSYFLWRERQMSRHFWSENNRICQYVTYYKPGVRVNRRVRICEWRRGVYTCFNPKRYFIYPVTRVVCYDRRDRRAVGAIVRPYGY